MNPKFIFMLCFIFYGCKNVSSYKAESVSLPIKKFQSLINSSASDVLKTNQGKDVYPASQENVQNASNYSWGSWNTSSNHTKSPQAYFGNKNIIIKKEKGMALIRNDSAFVKKLHETLSTNVPNVSLFGLPVNTTTPGENVQPKMMKHGLVGKSSEKKNTTSSSTLHANMIENEPSKGSPRKRWARAKTDAVDSVIDKLLGEDFSERGRKRQRQPDLASLPESSHETNFTSFRCRDRNSLNSDQLKESLDEPHNSGFLSFGQQKKTLAERNHLSGLSTQQGRLTQVLKLQTRRKRFFNLPFEQDLNHALETLTKQKISSDLLPQQELNQALKTVTRQKLPSSLPLQQNLNQELKTFVKKILPSGLPFEECLVSEILKTSIKFKCFSDLLFQKGLISQVLKIMTRRKRFSDLALEQCLVNEILKTLMRQKCFSDLPLKKDVSQVLKILKAQKLLSDLPFEQCLVSPVRKALTIQKLLSGFPLLRGSTNQVLKTLTKFFSGFPLEKCLVSHVPHSTNW